MALVLTELVQMVLAQTLLVLKEKVQMASAQRKSVQMVSELREFDNFLGIMAPFMTDHFPESALSLRLSSLHHFYLRTDLGLQSNKQCP